MRDGKKKRKKQEEAPCPRRAAWAEIYDLAAQGKVDELVRRKRADPKVLENNAGLWGETPLHYAAIENDMVTVRSLAAAGANVNAQDEFGAHVLASVVSIAKEAADADRREMVALLLELGASPWAEMPHYGMCCYHYVNRDEYADRSGRVALRALFAKFTPTESGHEKCAATLELFKDVEFEF
ncbi:MAG TPA: ankyrin repeat domain-containing protein [Phycisphaerales bacterium]|nr:ankyrin repeat domain-containing protein [Phycisphaerales bacterium]